jgi:hypothetical protein
LLVLLLLCPIASAGPEAGEKVYKTTIRGMVWILVPAPKEQSPPGTRVALRASGTGSLIDKTHRLVVTNFHVVGDATSVFVFFPQFDASGTPVAERAHYYQQLKAGQAINGRVLAKDDKRDLAIIELQSVPQYAQAIHLAREGASPAQTVHCLGNPGRSATLWGYTPGTVRGPAHFFRWKVSGIESPFEARVIETTHPVNGGDSGGPLVNDRAELVGVTQGHATGSDAQLISIFIDVSEVKAFLQNKKLLAKLPPPLAKDTPEVAVVKPASDKPPTDKTEPSVETVRAMEERANRNLDFAKTLAQDGKTKKAIDRYQKIVAEFPGTKAAEEAKVLLHELNK